MFMNIPEKLAGKYGARSDAEIAAPIVNLSRRGFVSSAGSLVVGMTLISACAPAETKTDVETEIAAEPTPSPLTEVKGGDATPSLFIEIEKSGKITVVCHRSEMGQQTWTAMTQLLADEMEAEWANIEIIQAVGDKKYGSQNTDGSTSVRHNFHRLRVTGAAMRSMLTQAAANEWGVDVATCRAEHGFVKNANGKKSLSYGDLAAAAAKIDIPSEDQITLKQRSEWRYIGKATPSLTVPKIIVGQGTFGIDVRLPNMVYAVVARPPQVMGTVESFDDKAALAIPGVLQTVKMPDATTPVGFNPLGGVAVVGNDTWAAIKGREALDVKWQAGPNASYNSGAYAEELKATARKSGEVRRDRGDVDAAMAAAVTKVEAEYYAPHLSQAPMEPPSATARWTDGKVECWACTQEPQAARSTVAQVCGVTEDDVTINVTWLGGGFGRKSKPDFVAEAALIARDVGRPVKLTWTREDALQHGYYHSVSAQKMEAGLDKDGKCNAFMHRTVFPTIMSTFAPGLDNPSWGELRLGAADTPFDVPNLRLESGKAAAHIRIGWLRSVSNIYHAFAVQSFAAEMAHAAGRDQKDYLLDLYGAPRLVDPNTEGAEYDNYGDPMEDYPIDTGRLANVTKVAAEMAGWGRELPAGHGLGIATHRSFLSYVSTVVEVNVADDGDMTIIGVWSAIDAGTVVNTGHTTAQVEGGTLYGLSNAMYGEITATNGVIDQANFPDWRVMRMEEAPRTMEVTIIESNAPPGGVGEPPTPPAAPALANAVFAATGHRMRSMPFFAAGENKLNIPTERG
jgi:isoquinoline 1-oxidoreductase beta subunit